MSLSAPAQVAVDMHAVDAQLRDRLRLLQAAQQTDDVKRAIAKLEFAIEAVADSCFPSMAIAIVPR